MTKLTVLLIEDEPQMRRFLRASLTASGHNLVEAVTGLDDEFRSLAGLVVDSADVLAHDAERQELDSAEEGDDDDSAHDDNDRCHDDDRGRWADELGSADIANS